MVKQQTPLCPKCFQWDNRILYSCQKPGCSKEGAPQNTAEAEVDGQNHPVCSDCKSPLSVRLCPLCGFPLEHQDTGTIALPLSIVGAQGVGKSNFLSVLINRIKLDLGKAYSCALHPVGGDATMAVYDRVYQYPLFVQGICPPSTQQEDLSPLQYSLVFSGERARGTTCNLTFYDAAGGNFESQRMLAEYNRSIYNAKGIFLLLDPAQLPGVQEILRMQGKPILDTDPGALLARIIHLIRTGRGLKNMQQKIDIPIAVCLTKLDTIKGLLDPSSFVGGSSRHLRDGALDRIDWESCNMEVQSLIECWGGQEIVNQVKAQFSKSGFFAFSALGSPPGDMGQVQKIMPHRILDPFLWLLWQNGNIECR